MKNNNLYALILAGGSGTRLWPVSREFFPKQFTNISATDSLIQLTVKRLLGFVDERNIFAVVGKLHEFQIINHLNEIGINPKESVISEPSGRDTAPAILLAALNILKKDSEAIMMVFPSDHIVGNEEEFKKCTAQAVNLAKEGYIATLGIKPTYPETGYGYIEAGDEIDIGSFKVKRFIEKPDGKDAEEYLKSGSFFWNSGMFIFKGQTILDQYKEHAELMYKGLKNTLDKGDELTEKIYNEIESISFDYAIMEKTDVVAVVPSGFKWSDVGSWKSVYDFLPKQKDNNVVEGDVFLNKSKNCLIKSDKRLVVANGLENIAIIDTDDAVLVSNLNTTEDIKDVVSKLKNDKNKKTQYHRKVDNPWGYYIDLVEQKGYRVKEIVVNPGSKLSLQSHKHRSEHWVITSGTAKVTNGKNVVVLNENESIFIPVGNVHRLENKGIKPLHIIEIQFGNYLNEDDIVRLEDDYGRECQ